MLKLSRFADYSIVLLTQMASRPPSLMQAPELALLSGLTVPTVAKTMKTLTQAGLVQSRRGTKGGYALLRDPSDIPVTEIIAAVDGPIALTECTVNAGSDCEIEALCPTRTNWRKINEAVIAALDGISLADMTPQKAPFMPYKKFEFSEFAEN